MIAEGEERGGMNEDKITKTSVTSAIREKTTRRQYHKSGVVATLLPLANRLRKAGD